MRKIVFIILLFIITGSGFIGCSRDAHTDDDAYNKVFEAEVIVSDDALLIPRIRIPLNTHPLTEYQ